MDLVKPPSPIAQKRSFASRLFGYDVFLSFALGPPPRGSHSYASDLARRLEQRDFTVFFSEEEMPPGEQLDGGLRKALLRSRALVVISNRGTLQDPRWVQKDVEAFRRGRPGRPVIPVNIGGALQDPSLAHTAQTWLDFVGRVWVDDTDEAVVRGIASQEVVDRLATVPRSARATTKWRWIVRGSVAALCALALGLAISTKAALDNARRARAELRDAVAARLVIQGQQMLNGSRGGGDLRGILQVLAANRISTTQEAAGALLEALLVTRNVRKLLATDVPVESLAISPDGQRIASGHQDHTVRLWDAATGQPVGHPLKGHLKEVVIVAYSLDGRLLASGSWDGAVQIWDASTGEARGSPLKVHVDPVTGLAFSPDGRRLVSSGLYGELAIWDSGTGRALAPPTENYRQRIRALAFGPDGRGIVSVGDGILYWDADTLKATGGPTQGDSGSLSAVAFSPAGESMVTGSDAGTLRLWDRRIKFNPDGRSILSFSLDGTIDLGHFGILKPRGAPLEGHSQTVRSVAFSPDGQRIVSGSYDGAVRLWNAGNGQPLGGPLEGHRALVSSVAFTPDGSVVSGSTMPVEGSFWVSTDPDTTRIRIWTPVPSASLGQVFKSFPDVVRAVAFSPDGHRIAMSGEHKTLRVWDVATGEPVGASLDHLDMVTSVAFSPDGRLLASGSGDGTIRIWDVETGRTVTTLRGESSILSVAFSPDGQRLASGSEATTRYVRDALNISRRRSGEDGELRLWDVVTGSLLSVSQAHKQSVTSVAFSPDDRRIVSAGGTVRLWDAKSGESVGELLAGHTDSAERVAVSADGRLIASCGRDTTIRLWDGQTGRAIGAPLHGHRASVAAIAFSPDGRQLVSGGWDNTIRVWDTLSGRPLGPPLEGHTGLVTAVAFSPDGLGIVSAATDNAVLRWPAPRAWAGVLCSKVTRNLSDQEWREWVSAEIPYECQCSGLPIPADDGRIEQSRTCNVR